MNESDLISRQAAIDAIDAWIQLYVLGRTTAEVVSLQDVIRALPSAQPEIIRCKNCKYFEYDHPYIIQGIPVLGHEVCNAWGDGCKTDENGYCFMAERREDG